MQETLIKAQEVASKIIIEAGNIAKDRFDNSYSIEEKDDFGDVVTEVDHLAEDVILKELSTFS